MCGLPSGVWFGEIIIYIFFPFYLVDVPCLYLFSNVQHVNRFTHEDVSTSARQHINTSTRQHVSMPERQHVRTSARQHISTQQHVNMSTRQHIHTSSDRRPQDASEGRGRAGMGREGNEFRNKKKQNGGPKFEAQKWHQFLVPANIFFFLGGAQIGSTKNSKSGPQKTNKKCLKRQKKCSNTSRGGGRGGEGKTEVPAQCPGATFLIVI